jgi:hypothetical protein
MQRIATWHYRSLAQVSFAMGDRPFVQQVKPGIDRRIHAALIYGSEGHSNGGVALR